MNKTALTPLILLVSLLLFACGKEDPQDQNITLSQTAVEIDFEETFRLDATFIRDGYSPSGFIWESANPNIATVSDNGTVTGLRVGTTIVTVLTADRLFSADCEVTVNPTNFLYIEPLFDFGQNKAFIRENETRTFWNEYEDALLFEGENENVYGVVYVLPETLYEYSYVLLNIETEAELMNVIAFLDQRYEMLGYNEGFLIFENEDILLGISEDEEGFFVLYLPNTEPAGANSKVDRLRKFSQNDLLINRRKR